MQHDARADPGAAVRDDLAVGELRQGLVPRSVPRTRDATGDAVDRVGLAAPAGWDARVDDHQVVARSDLLRGDRVALARTCHERRRLDRFLARGQRSFPGVEVDDGAVVVAEVPQEPPESLRAADRSVGDDEDTVTDPGAPGCGGEPLGGRQGMAPRTGNGEIREVLVDVEERGARDVAGEVQLAPTARISELPATIDELIAHRSSIPFRSPIV